MSRNSPCRCTHRAKIPAAANRQGRPLLRFAYLGSGSRGNAALVASGRTCVMIDCGFSATETEKRLARLNLCGGDIEALLVTHEHADHIGGVGAFARRHRCPVWMTPGTYAACADRRLPDLRLLNCHSPLRLGDLLIEPLPVPHDAREPCQFVVGEGNVRLGVLTDTGHITPHIRRCLDACDALVLECNHDIDMLASGPYPPALRARVGGKFGHLNNHQAADLLSSVQQTRLQHVVAVHVSEKNNTGELARRALAGALGCGHEDVQLADQGGGLDWREIR